MSTTTPKSRTWTSPDGVTFTAVEVYRDQAGHVYYGFEDPLKMPAARAIEAELAAEWANLNVTRDDLRAFLASMREHGQKGDIVGLFQVLANLQDRVEWACEGRSLLELAKVYYLVDDEPIERTTERHNEIKARAWASDNAAKGFFLREAFVLTRGFSEFSASDILAYSVARETIAMRLRKERTSSSSAPKRDRAASMKSFLEGATRSKPKPS